MIKKILKIILCIIFIVILIMAFLLGYIGIDYFNRKKVSNLNEENNNQNDKEIITTYQPSTEININWAKIYGTLQKGTYRIVKKVSIGSDFQWIYAEFSI